MSNLIRILVKLKNTNYLLAFLFNFAIISNKIERDYNSPPCSSNYNLPHFNNYFYYSLSISHDNSMSEFLYITDHTIRQPSQCV